MYSSGAAITLKVVGKSMILRILRSTTYDTLYLDTLYLDTLYLDTLTLYLDTLPTYLPTLPTLLRYR